MTANNFLEYFKTLEGTTLPEDPYPELDEESIFEELDKEIIFEEIRNAVKNTKNEKSCGPDLMLNETFKYYIDLLLPSLHYLFNNILNNGFSHLCGPELSSYRSIKRAPSPIRTIIAVSA